MSKNLFRIALIFCILAASLLVGGTALAQDEELPDPGLTPDSPLYFLDKMGKGLGMAFAFGNEAKAQKALEYAEERLAEARAMAEKNRAREMENATEEYDEYMARVRQRVEEASQQGAADNVTERVAQATSNHLAVLERLKENLPEAAQAGIDRAIAASENGQVNALRALAKNKPEKAIEISQAAIDKGLERVRVRTASGNATSGNATGSLNYAARLAELEDELITTAEEMGIDPTRLRQQLAQATTNRLEVLAEVHERAPEQARAGLENAIENSVRKYERAVEKLKESDALGNIPEESPAMQRITEAVKNRLRTANAEKFRAAANVTDNASLQNRLREEIKEKVREQVENKRPKTRGTDDERENELEDEEEEEEEDEDEDESNTSASRRNNPAQKPTRP